MNRPPASLLAAFILGAVVRPLLAQPPSPRMETRARYLGSIPCRTPAMTFLRPLRQGERDALIVCSFGMLGRDAVRVVPEPGARLWQLDQTRPELLTDEVVWPNEALPVPGGALGFDALTVAGGFLVPGKNPGAVVLLPLPRGQGFGRMHPLKVTTEQAGWFYHRAEWMDVDGDGRLDLLVTNHESDVQASVFAYEIPDDFRRDRWSRRTLLSGIETRQPGINSASPGAATAFHPIARSSSRKPWILVSGDGSRRAHLLEPLSRSPEDWSYQESILADAESTVGTCAVGDTDGDGCAEVFVPAYNRDRILVYTFAR